MSQDEAAGDVSRAAGDEAPHGAAAAGTTPASTKTSLLLDMLRGGYGAPPPPYRPFGCSRCDFEAASTDEVHAHSRRVHRGAEPARVRFIPPGGATDAETGYSCGHCGESRFASPELVTAHVIAVHSAAPQAVPPAKRRASLTRSDWEPAAKVKKGDGCFNGVGFEI